MSDSATVAGAEYVRAMTARRSDRLARAAFQRLALSLVKPGGMVFDFGAGPGIDARFYAERGHPVGAYDPDPVMCEYFATECADLIQARRVTLEGGAYGDFLSQPIRGRRADLITANFAPLNLVGDLRPLFAKFAELTEPGGCVLASVLSPYFAGDLRYGWWWRNLIRLWRTGHFSVQGAQAPIVRRRLRDYEAQCDPHFVLARVFRGLTRRSGRGILAEPQLAAVPAESEQECAAAPQPDGGGPPGPYAWLRGTACQFMFLLFSKR